MPTPPKQRPGFKRRPVAQFSDTRESWVKTGSLDVVMYVNPHSPEGEVGEDHILTFVHPNRRPLAVNLTGLTEEELNAVQMFLNRAFEQARPIIQERDKVADDAFDQGDDSFVRNYRRPPELVVRTRKVRSNSEGVHDGPQAVPPLGEGTGGADQLSGEDGPAVAQRVPEGAEPEHNGSASVQPPGVLLVGGGTDDSGGLQPADAEQDSAAPDSGGDRRSDADAGSGTDPGAEGPV